MATYKHGISISEKPTSVLPPVEVTAGIPFIVGTAPVNMGDVTNVNKPTLCYGYDEAVAAFGYVPPVETAGSTLKKHEYTISEFIRSQFALYGVNPVIIVNVLDPAKHKKTADTTTVNVDNRNGTVTVKETGILLDTVKIEGETYLKDTDFVMSFDSNGYLVISSLTDADGEYKVECGKDLTFTAEKLDPSAVTVEDITGGVDTTGNKSGFELVSECFPRFRLVPGILLAPGYSSDPALAAIMGAKAANINEVFKAVSLIDVPTNTVKRYTDVAAWKNDNNITDALQICCYPMLAQDDVVYNQSTQLAGLLGQVDGENDDVPFVSPSNKNYQMTAAVLADGTEVWLGQDAASYLNGEGVVTALNFIGGWKCWGNRTACYPGSTDPKDAFIPVRRMFNWIGNSLVQTYWQQLDAPLNRRQIDTVVDMANIWLNGLTARQHILGGRLEFLESENPSTDLIDGKAKFHLYITPASPNREIDFVLEYDPSYLEGLFG